jgi:hypothetical protein
VPDASYLPSVPLAPDFTLRLNPSTAACGAASPGNLQWSVTTMGSIFGFQPQNGCSTGAPFIFIGAAGANTNGCWGANQITPQVGYPCGGYGDPGVHLELWVR